MREGYIIVFKARIMGGVELILSTICNISTCGPDYVPPLSSLAVDTVGTGFEMRTAKAMVNGKHFRVGTFNDGVRGWTQVDEDGKVFGHGIAFFLIQQLSYRLKFSYEIVLPPTHLNNQNRTAKEDWLVGMLIDHKIDIAAAFITFTMERKDLITFALETDTVNCLVESETEVHRRRVSDYKRHSLQAFSVDVWCCFLVTLIVFVVCLVLLTRLRSKLINDDEEPFTLASSLFYVYRATIQDVLRYPKANMTRILLITWSLFVFLVSNYFTAYLSHGYTVTAVARMEDMDRGLSLLKTTGISLDLDDATICSPKVLLKNLIKRPSGLAYPQNSTISRVFARELQNIYNTGTLHSIYKSHAEFIKKICAPSTDYLHQLKTGHLAKVYYYWIAGTVNALVVFIVEIVLKTLMKPREPSEARTQREQAVISGLVGQRYTPPDRRRSRSRVTPRQPSSFQRRVVNGRQYLVARNRNRNVTLIPVNTLSALRYNLDLYERA